MRTRSTHNYGSWAGLVHSLHVALPCPLPSRIATLSPNTVIDSAPTDVSLQLGEWTPNWASAYPAVRDLKAAIRFVRAKATEYGVDPSRVVSEALLVPPTPWQQDNVR